MKYKYVCGYSFVHASGIITETQMRVLLQQEPFLYTPFIPEILQSRKGTRNKIGAYQ
jgi:hypothetical protein